MAAAGTAGEIVSYLHGMMANANDQIVSVALDTVGVLLERYSCYPERFVEEKEVCEERRGRLLGILLSGLANYRESVRQEAMLVLGQTVFGSSWMECREKKELFALSFRKMLFLFNENKGNELTAFYRAASLSNIYRFITQYHMTEGNLEIKERNQVAFFQAHLTVYAVTQGDCPRDPRPRL